MLVIILALADAQTECSDGCIPYMLSNGICDLECFTERCSFDQFDCQDYCAPGCLKTKSTDDECQPECNVKECDYDNDLCIDDDIVSILIMVFSFAFISVVIISICLCVRGYIKSKRVRVSEVFDGYDQIRTNELSLGTTTKNLLECVLPVLKYSKNTQDICAICLD